VFYSVLLTNKHIIVMIQHFASVDPKPREDEPFDNRFCPTFSCKSGPRTFSSLGKYEHIIYKWWVGKIPPTKKIPGAR
jgi:hypothetical protein